MAVKLEIKKATYVILSIVCYSLELLIGLFDYMRSVLFNSIQKEFSLADDSLALIISSLGYASIFYYLFTTLLINCMTIKALNILSLCIWICGIAVFYFIHNYYLLIFALFLFWFGTASTDIGLNALITHIFVDNSQFMVGIANCFYGVGGLICPFIYKWLLKQEGSSYRDVYMAYCIPTVIIILLIIFTKYDYTITFTDDNDTKVKNQDVKASESVKTNEKQEESSTLNSNEIKDIEMSEIESKKDIEMSEIESKKDIEMSEIKSKKEKISEIESKKEKSSHENKKSKKQNKKSKKQSYSFFKESVFWTLLLVVVCFQQAHYMIIDWSLNYLEVVWGWETTGKGADFIQIYGLTFTLGRIAFSFIGGKLGSFNTQLVLSIGSCLLILIGFLTGEVGNYLIACSGFFLGPTFPTMMTIIMEVWGQESTFILSMVITLYAALKEILNYSIGLLNTYVGTEWGYRLLLLISFAQVILHICCQLIHKKQVLRRKSQKSSTNQKPNSIKTEIGNSDSDKEENKLESTQNSHQTIEKITVVSQS
ncbi:hypothetical protein WA158_000570 [Blastocystis sp. Blastoise]